MSSHKPTMPSVLSGIQTGKQILLELKLDSNAMILSFFGGGLGEWYYSVNTSYKQITPKLLPPGHRDPSLSVKYLKKNTSLLPCLTFSFITAYTCSSRPLIRCCPHWFLLMTGLLFCLLTAVSASSKNIWPIRVQSAALILRTSSS